jgi:hypothetical protein
MLVSIPVTCGWRNDKAVSQHSTGSGAPRWGRPSQSKSRSGISRSSLYEIARQHKGVFKKMGSATLVDYDKVDEILADLPDANIEEKTPA